MAMNMRLKNNGNLVSHSLGGQESSQLRREATLPPKAPRENLSFAFSSFGGSEHPLACSSITPVSASIFTWPSFLYVSCLSLPFLQGHLSSHLGLS